MVDDPSRKKITVELEIGQAERIRDMLFGFAPTRMQGKTDHELYELFRDAINKSRQSS